MFGKPLPSPTTFAEGQRKLFGLLMVASGIWSGAVALGLTIFMAALAFRFPAHRALILYILAGGLGSYLVMQSIVMVAMAVGGPVGRFKVSANQQGASLEAAGDGEPVDPAESSSVPEMPSAQQ